MANRTTLLLLAFVIYLMIVPATGWCDAVNFNVNPSDIMVPRTGEFDLFSNGLNGTFLAGQTQSLDLVFSNHILARIFSHNFGILLIVSTNAGTYPGFFGPTTSGYLLDAAGHQLGPTLEAGRAQSSNGNTAAGLFPSFAGGIGEISGVHFDLAYPDTGYAITNATMRFSLYDENSRALFGTAQQLAEPSSLLLLATGLAGVIIRIRILVMGHRP